MLPTESLMKTRNEYALEYNQTAQRIEGMKTQIAADQKRLEQLRGAVSALDRVINDMESKNKAPEGDNPPTAPAPDAPVPAPEAAPAAGKEEKQDGKESA